LLSLEGRDEYSPISQDFTKDHREHHALHVIFGLVRGPSPAGTDRSDGTSRHPRQISLRPVLGMPFPRRAHDSFRRSTKQPDT